MATYFPPNSTSSNTTSQPSVLTLDVTALARGQGAPSDTAGSGEFDNVKYSGTMTGTQAELLAAIGNAANWTGSNTALTQETANFTVTGGGADLTPPSLVGTNPADDASNVSAASNIVLTFDEAVQAGTGNIVISDGAGDTRTIDVTDASQVTFGTNTVTINPTGDLNPATAYDVTIGSGVITDAAANPFAGIALDALDFTTASATIPGSTDIGGIAVLAEAASLQGAAAMPVATNSVELVRLGSFAATGGNAEVVSFDPTTDQLYILNADRQQDRDRADLGGRSLDQDRRDRPGHA